MTNLYMLGTDTCAFILRRSSQPLLDRMQTVPLEHQCMSMCHFLHFCLKQGRQSSGIVQSQFTQGYQ